MKKERSTLEVVLLALQVLSRRTDGVAAIFHAFVSGFNPAPLT